MFKRSLILKRFKSVSNNSAKEAQLIYNIDADTSREYRLDVLKTTKRGLDVLKDPLLNKGTAFSYPERERLRIRGLLPPRMQDMQKQLLRNKQYQNQASITPDEQKEWQNLQLYKDLGALQDRNETLFYRYLMDDFKRLAPIIYTPTVAQACLKSHHIYRQARGMYFSIQDRGHFSSMTYNWPHDVKVIVVTDGSRVLGLGDLGCNGMPIPVGKLALYVAAGGLPPNSVLPVVLDVGTNNKQLRNDPLYLGTPVERLEGKEYYDFLDEWMHAIYSRWPRVLVQFEDFKNPHAQALLAKYRDKFCCFNDDIQSTGAVTLAGVLSSLKARGKEYSDLCKERIVCLGAGSAGIGVCDTIVEAMLRLGCVSSRAEGYSKFYMMDQFGLLGHSRPDDQLTNIQKPYQRSDLPSGMSLLDVVKEVKPTILLGLSGAGGAFTKEVVEEMSRINEQPVIFPLSNPTKNSECSAEQACEWSGGRALFASGSPFADVNTANSIFNTSQCNNYYIFPGMGLGITTCQAASVPNSFFQEAAMVVANRTTFKEDGRLFPQVQHIREISFDIAVRVCQLAEKEGLATRLPPRGMQWPEFVKSKMWDPTWYQTTVPI